MPTWSSSCFWRTGSRKRSTSHWRWTRRMCRRCGICWSSTCWRRASPAAIRERRSPLRSGSRQSTPRKVFWRGPGCPAGGGGSPVTAGSANAAVELPGADCAGAILPGSRTLQPRRSRIRGEAGAEPRQRPCRGLRHSGGDLRGSHQRQRVGRVPGGCGPRGAGRSGAILPRGRASHRSGAGSRKGGAVSPRVPGTRTRRQRTNGGGRRAAARPPARQRSVP